MPQHTRDYVIHGFTYDNGQIIFDVNHFDENGNDVGKQYYTFQGRVGHRTLGLSWESVIQIIERIHPKMVSGEVKPDTRAPRMQRGHAYDFTGIELQKNKGQIHKLIGLSRKLSQHGSRTGNARWQNFPGIIPTPPRPPAPEEPQLPEEAQQ